MASPGLVFAIAKLEEIKESGSVKIEELFLDVSILRGRVNCLSVEFFKLDIAAVCLGKGPYVCLYFRDGNVIHLAEVGMGRVWR